MAPFCLSSLREDEGKSQCKFSLCRCVSGHALINVIPFETWRKVGTQQEYWQLQCPLEDIFRYKKAPCTCQLFSPSAQWGDSLVLGQPV